jgi:N-acetylmuramoyl-L-alanine amidase
MRRFLLAGLVAVQVAGAQTQRIVPASPRPAPVVRRTVIVDAGHGGVDRGMSGRTATGARVFEKDIALGVARKVAARLQNAGVSVVMTRDSDTLIALSDRGHIANREQGDLFISVHVNAANQKWRNPTAARGFETYFLAEAKTEDERRVAEMENEAAKYEDSSRSTENDPLSFMLTDMLQNEHLRESSAFAQAIQSSLGAAHPGPSRGVKQAGFRVLVTAFMPAVLVEIGFGTNPSEASWLASSAGQAQLADAISRATLNYLAQYERRASGGSGGSGARR